MGHGSSSPQPFGDSRVVKTKFGNIIGRRFVFDKKEESNSIDAFQVDAFQGIPYASPPVGALRFKKPEWPQPWSDVKSTKKFAARGVQKDLHCFEKIKLGEISEDNLYLNVFTPVWSPDPDSEGFAVLVFIHGGAFICDSAVKYGDVGICEHLCTKDVVVVTIQYRLGFLGFFSTGDEHCPGNFGLWDQTLALKWIQENIAAFNGDPGNVTVMGQSAGGACMIDALRKLPFSKFALSLMDNTGKSSLEKCCPVGPRLDFDFIPKSVSELRKEASAKPMLIGCCASEGLLFLGFERNYCVGKIMEYVSLVVPEKEYPRMFKRYREEIFQKLLSDPENSEEVARGSVEIFGDLLMNVAVQTAVQETLESHDAPVYFYSYDYCNPKSWEPLSSRWPFIDATHCTELTYIFAVGNNWDFEFNDNDKRMLELTTRMWTNFAKYG
ncbi:unnamed protein product [Haemonchus placei]|uniref:COesterase domain-containing protein n=1 Tax=Haemonchus placei TaxID=6290 RepID=A0A0N4X6E0_HAEPC|nr:unnamed protein product [Haemonchus placei]